MGKNEGRKLFGMVVAEGVAVLEVEEVAVGVVLVLLWPLVSFRLTGRVG